MTATTILDLYRSPINVWVEDNLTREFLTGVWQDSQLHVLHAAGVEGVRHMVNAAAGLPNRRNHVVGVIDRDFDADNMERWADPELPLYRLPVHEIENLLLDFDILATLATRSADEIRTEARRYAVGRRPWMVGKAILREVRRDLSGNFPSDPPSELADDAAVHGWLHGNKFWSEHRTSCDRWQETAHRTTRLAAYATELDAHLTSDAWLANFSGKEIFRHLRSCIPGLDRTPRRDPSTAPQRDEDLAKRVARAMRERGRVPDVLQTLRRHLRTRAGLPA